MIASLIVLILIAGTMADVTVPYTGFRVSLNKETVQNSHFDVLKATSMNSPSATWPDQQMVIGSGLFSLGFYVTGIKCTVANFDPKVLTTKTTTFSPNTVKYDLAGPALTHTFTFSYDFQILGLHLFFGTGQVVISSNTMSTIQAFVSESVSTSFTSTWTTKVSSISGFDLMGGITSWVTKIFDTLHNPNMVNVLLPVIGGYTKTLLDKWLNLHDYFYPDGSLNMTLKSSMLSVSEVPAGYLTFAFATRVTVDDRPYIKKLWRVVSSAVTTTAKAQVCVTSSTIPAMMEVRGKARDFIYTIDPTQIGLKGKIRDFVNVMPKLEEMYDLDADTYIGCRPYGDDDIVLLNEDVPGQDLYKIQVPITCSIGAKAAGKDILVVNFIVRSIVTKMVGADATNTFVINGIAGTPGLYNLKIGYSVVPVTGFDTFVKMLQKSLTYLTSFQLLPVGLKVPIPMTITTPTKTLTKEEYCFDYN